MSGLSLSSNIQWKPIDIKYLSFIYPCIVIIFFQIARDFFINLIFFSFYQFFSFFHFFISFRFLFIIFSLSFISSFRSIKYFKRYKFYQVINYCSLFFCIVYFYFDNERNWFFLFYQIISFFPLFLFLNKSLISSSLI